MRAWLNSAPPAIATRLSPIALVVVLTVIFVPTGNLLVFITVTKGQITFYESDDPTCTPHTVSVGQGYQDTGHGHIGRNETGEPAQDVSVIIAPVGGAFRGELPAPSPHCKF